MRIVFCYIDGHKNLDKGQFNFDPNFKYFFKEEVVNQRGGVEKALIKKECVNIFEQPLGFFGDNISNITGIIGVNGSGKTSILEAIFNESGETNIENKSFKYLVLFKDFEGNYSYISSEETNVFLDGQEEMVVKLNKKINYLYIDNNLSKKNKNFSNKNTLINKSNLSSSYFIEKENGEIHGYAKKDLKLVIRLLAKHSAKNILSKKAKINLPKFLHLKFRYNEKTEKIQEILKIQEVQEAHEFKELEELNNKMFLDFIDFSGIQKEINEEAILNIKNLLNLFKKFIKINYNFMRLSNDFSDEKDKINDHLKKIQEGNIEIKYPNEFHQKVLALYEDLSLESFDTVESLIENKKNKIIQLLAFYSYIYITVQTGIDNFIVEGNTIKVRLKTQGNKAVLFFINYFDHDQLIGSRSSNVRYSYDIEMSSGEKSLLSLYSRLYSKFFSDKKGSWIVFLDEPEFTLHPEWQRNLLQLIIEFTKQKTSEEFNVQFIMSSHSPFLASDLPRENIIKLEKGLMKKFKETERTFSANIYDFYKDSFFLTNTISEFSKNKIEEIIFQINEGNLDEQKKKDIYYTIDSIGDKILRVHLKTIFKDKINTSRKEKIKIELKELGLNKVTIEKMMLAYEED